MKKALSILLCLAMLVSTVPVSVFAAPSVSHTKDSVLEQNGDSANLAEEPEKVEVSITYVEGEDSQLQSGKNTWTTPVGTSYFVGDSYKIPALYKPATRFESTKAGYKVVNEWTDGRNYYAPGDTIVLTGDLVLWPRVNPDGPAYTINFNVAEEFASLYNGPSSLLVAVNR